jgi:hypothetical protein
MLLCCQSDRVPHNNKALILNPGPPNNSIHVCAEVCVEKEEFSITACGSVD